LAGLDGDDARACFFDYAGDVAAGNVRERDWYTGKAAAYPQVEVIERAGVYPDEDFAVTEFGLGNVGVAENVGAAVVVKEDGFHDGGRIVAWTWK